VSDTDIPMAMSTTVKSEQNEGATDRDKDRQTRCLKTNILSAEKLGNKTSTQSIHTLGSRAAKSVGPITERSLVRIPEPGKVK
jgi:hypothetical protein